MHSSKREGKSPKRKYVPMVCIFTETCIILSLPSTDKWEKNSKNIKNVKDVGFTGKRGEMDFLKSKVEKCGRKWGVVMWSRFFFFLFKYYHSCEEVELVVHGHIKKATGGRV